MGLITELVQGGASRRPGQATGTGGTAGAVWLPAALVLTGTGWGSNQITPLLLVYQRTLALSTGAVAAMFGIYALGLIPGLLVAGPVSDVRGRRFVVIPAVVLSLLASAALIAGGHQAGLLFAGRLLAGVSSGAAFGAGTAWVRELSLPPHGLAADHTAARRAAIAMTLGFALGPLVAGILAQWAPDPAVVPYLPHLVLMALTLLAVRGTPETITRSRQATVIRAVPEVRSARFTVGVVVMAPWVFAAPAIAFALLPSIAGADRAANGIGLVAADTTVCALAGVLVQPLARRLEASPAGSRAATTGLLVLVAGLALSAATAQLKYLWLLVPCAVVLGAAYGLCLVAGLVEIQRLADPGHLAGLTAIYYTLTYTGFAVPYILAMANRLASYPALLWATAALALLTAAIPRPSAQTDRSLCGSGLGQRSARTRSSRR